MRDSEKQNCHHGGSIAYIKERAVQPRGKTETVRRCLGNEKIITAINQELSVDKAAIRNWIAQYETEGTAGFLPQERNHTYEEEVKQATLQEYQSREGSFREISKKYGLRDESVIHRWVKVYNAHGDFTSRKYSGEESYIKQERETTYEERIQIVQDCIASGKNDGEMALKYQVSYQQIHSWTIRYEEFGKAGVEDRRGRR